MNRELRHQLETFFALKHGSLNDAFEYYQDNQMWYTLTPDERDAIQTGSYKESLRESGFDALTKI